MIFPAQEEFLDCIRPLLEDERVKSMKRWRHHFAVTCWEHSVCVSYVAFRLARRFGWDERSAARAGLLHDFYLYDPADKSAHPGNQCFDHPEFALRNAEALCPDLTEAERNAIASHMFPLAVHLPRSRVAVAVNLADKLCAAVEVAHLYRIPAVREHMPARIPAT